MKINSISAVKNYECLDFQSNLYIINKGFKNEILINKDKNNNDIILDDIFKHGYKVVKNKSNTYSYLCEETNELMPYEFDIAFDFNEYGLAMVGNNNKVTWINTNFEYLDNYGKFIKLNSNSIKGYDSISNFNNRKINLAKVVQDNLSYNKVGYINTDGILQIFNNFNNDFTYGYFANGSDFNEEGIATSLDYLLFEKGYYIAYKDLINYLSDNGYIKEINNEINKNGKLLIKK